MADEQLLDPQAELLRAIAENDVLRIKLKQVEERAGSAENELEISEDSINDLEDDLNDARSDKRKLLIERDRLKSLNAHLEANLTATQTRCTELLLEVRRYRQRCLPHPGWICEGCGVFNGETTHEILACRSCEAPAPTGDTMEPEERMEKLG